MNLFLRALGALAIAALLAACGSSANTSSSGSAAAGASSGKTSTSRSALAACLRQHGVTLPAGGRPGSGGPPAGAPAGGSGAPPAGGSGAPPGGGPPAGFPAGEAGSSKFRAALKACGANFRAGGRGPGFGRQTIQKYVTCVRQHGYKLPSPNFSNGGPVFPSSIRSSAKFQAASKACQNLLLPVAGSASGGGE
jgi:hypothetical protein